MVSTSALLTIVIVKLKQVNMESKANVDIEGRLFMDLMMEILDNRPCLWLASKKKKTCPVFLVIFMPT